MAEAADILARLQAVIEARKGGDPETSYVAKRFSQGRAKIAQKVGEEAVECAIAAVSGDREAVVAESADLLFHLMILWADAGIAPDDVLEELARREGVSGIDEKKSRGT
jgi:phosphoribosyl-ATP pyrophosphohydrolase